MCSTNCAKLRTLSHSLTHSPTLSSCGVDSLPNDKLTTQLTETSPQCTASELRLQPSQEEAWKSRVQESKRCRQRQKETTKEGGEGEEVEGAGKKGKKKAKNIDSMRCDSIVAVRLFGLLLLMGKLENGLGASLGCFWLLQVSRTIYILYIAL